MTSSDQLRSSRTIDAPAEAIFAVLSDPSRHRDTDPSDWGWVRDAPEPEPLTRADQVFVINMFHPKGEGDGHYVMHNRVTAFEPARTIAWEPGQLSGDGRVESGGWWWRYDLEPAGAQTNVTLTYDWSHTPEPVRREIGGLPPFGPDYLADSLGALDAAVQAKE